MNSPRAKGRPSQALLSRKKIADSALILIEENGYEKLTMARIARRMGVAPSALYNHVSNKHELLILVEDAVMAQVETVPLDAALDGSVDPLEAIERWAESYRAVFARHAPLVEVIASVPVSGAPRAVQMYEKVARVFELAGVAQELILPRVIMLESFIYGSALDVNAPANLFEVPENYEVQAPTLRKSHESWARSIAMETSSAENPFAEEPFRLGLRALLKGIAD
ncbi:MULTISPECIES: TetR/AcrR family transcriptional regulator [Corynebacterium]|uniref:TetR/AcrR family transcriptional regulator n=1 Tax=Corynebacterium TaxID=1716 RepID=UPI00257B14B3|nr:MULTISPECIES: TetR/AcrR family transcriptional regulator [Corynebacterium]